MNLHRPVGSTDGKHEGQDFPVMTTAIPLRRQALSRVPSETLAQMLYHYTSLEADRNRITREMKAVQAEFQRAIENPRRV